MEEVKNIKIVKTPAAEYLFTLNTNEKNLYLADVFHTKIAKASFLGKRSRPNIQPTVPFFAL